MENNIFKGIKFGDKFLTRNKGIALYISTQKGYNPLGGGEWKHNFIVQNAGGDQTRKYKHKLNGTYIKGYIDEFDIVSKYQEPIDENSFSKKDKMKLIEDVVDYIKRFGIKETSVSQIYEHLFSDVTEW